ncbi:MAG: hypothetical protein RML12_04665 [Xanthomonadales bacterium]|nr:hypothetical protein [Xanthomonadales bacterium]
MLAELGIEAVGAEHALAALAESERAAFDAALIDLDLPGVDGFECARLLRERADREGAPAAATGGDHRAPRRRRGGALPSGRSRRARCASRLGLARLEELFGRGRR